MRSSKITNTEKDNAMNATTQSTNQATIAKTILQQMGGASRLQAMVNAKNFISAETDGNCSLTFYHMKGQNKSNCTRITLMPNDTYTVEFLWVRSPNCTVRSTHENVYGNALISFWESETELCLTFR